MLTSSAAVPLLTECDFRTIRDYIYEKSGIWFADNKKYLVESRLHKRMQELGIGSYRDYLYRVKYDASNKEFEALMDVVTTNETSFFRNPPQLKAFAEEVLPLVIKEKNKQHDKNRSLKIWSAGCSSGEEPYTLGIILLEVLRSTIGWNIEIIANDISQRVLYAARKGIYQELSLRTTDSRIIDTYFINDNGNYRIRDDVKRLIKFNHINLNDPRQTNTIVDCDLIFCRNVMIYFSDEVKKSLVKQFYKCLRPGGYFFIGHSESLHGISKAFQLEYFKNALVYHKKATPVPETTQTRDRAANKHADTLDALAKVRELLSKK